MCPFISSNESLNERGIHERNELLTPQPGQIFRLFVINLLTKIVGKPRRKLSLKKHWTSP